MSKYIDPADGISQAWLAVLEAMNAEADGTATNVMVTIPSPTAVDITEVRRVLDDELRARGQHEVATVANTLFPSTFYQPPEHDWAPALPRAAVAELDDAAELLYAEYLGILPSLRRIPANARGTYFSRMISWPGKTGNGTNQLKDRIEFLRKEQVNGRATSNASDLVIAGDGENEIDGAGGGIQEYAATDRRPQGFPCLVHIDVSVHKGNLSLTAIYRHWHLITRAYGNMVGLTRLQSFLCQQTGFKVGELVVVAGYANAERGQYGGRSGVRLLLERAAAAATPPAPVAAA